MLAGRYHLGPFGIVLSQLFAVLLPAVFFSHHRREEFLKSVGLKPWIPSFAIFGTLFGICWFLVILCWIQPCVERFFPLTLQEQEKILSLLRPDTSLSALAVNLLCFAWFPAFCEEILFRGTLLPAIASIEILKQSPFWKRGGIALLLSSLFFGIFHLSFGKGVMTFFLGLGFGVVVLITRSLWASIFMHATNNTIVLLLLRKNLGDDGLTLKQKLIATGIAFLLGLSLIRYTLAQKIPSEAR